MSTLEEIEEAIDRLPKDQVFALSERLQQRVDKEWDTQFESDVATGRLSEIAEKALQQYRAGNSKEFPNDEK